MPEKRPVAPSELAKPGNTMRQHAQPIVPPSTSLAITPRDWLLLIALGVLWGGSYFFGKVAVEDIGPLTVVFGRVVLAGALLFAAIKIRQVPIPTTWTAWKPLFVMGLLNSALPYTLIFWGETRISSGLAAILTAMAPVFTVIVAHFWTVDERMTPAKAAGIGLGMAGVLVVVGRDLGSLTSGSGLAKLAILGATMSYAISGVYGRRLKGQSPMVLAWGQMCTAILWLLPMVVVVDRPWETAEWHLDAVLSVISLAIFSTAVAYLIFFRLLANIGATNTSLVAFLIPISSLALGFLFLGEHLVMTQLLGMLLIGGGMCVIDGRIWKALRGNRQPAAYPVADS